ncbi:ran-binding protein [Plasmopara halstedii]|uniref:Ran-binding protein n=1 Tax=Plasmopara halstedii TaxID=4781 RepID=A0A0N7L397_PLAHL|nr:ran-binding protein [Plasmopara halstedii]CEG35267.1 ran-binding protein [Plasmopara halstedii]|eukprot:XP_024571636.1 ran-binding protein [Plasmopara halstedii]
MATKGDHEKPETVDNEHQPTIKKVRLDEDANVAEDVKKVKIDEDAIPQPEIGSHEDAVQKMSSPVTKQDAGSNTNEKVPKEVKPNTNGSAFGGFSAFCGKNAFAAYTTPANTNGFCTKPSSTNEPSFAKFTAETSTADDTSTQSITSIASSSQSGGFASFQGKSPVTFASFATAQSSPDDFGAKASSALATDFLDSDVAQKVEPVVPALTEAELANGEEGEHILVEKRAKLFKLVEKDYTEVGIGPLRVLSAKDSAVDKVTARVVMRRESYPHGPGTKLLLNASLGSCLLCEKKTEKTMQLTVLEANEDSREDNEFTPVTYLLRYGSPEDLDMMMMRFQAHMHLSTSVTSSS